MNADKPGIYLDTSALLPYYREEKNSRAIQGFLSSLSLSAGISDLTELEFTSVLSRWVRIKELNEAQANLVEDAFKEDKRSNLFRRLSITTKHYRQAHKWISARRTALRALDALHLACSFADGLEMVTCDKMLAKSADVLGVPYCFVENQT